MCIKYASKEYHIYLYEHICSVRLCACRYKSLPKISKRKSKNVCFGAADMVVSLSYLSFFAFIY